MPIFTIETTYLLPVYRQRSYEAETLYAACALAITWNNSRLKSSAVGILRPSV